MNKEEWYSIPEFPNYEINSNGVTRHINGKLLRLWQHRGYSLERNGQQRYIRPSRLLYAALHGISPIGVKNIVVLDVDGVLTPMTRAEYAQFVNQKRKYGMLNREEAKEYYKKSILFAQMMLEYYETGDATSVIDTLSKYENYVKNYIRKKQYSNNESTINEAWNDIYCTILSEIHDGRISIIDPRNYILRCTRSYFSDLRKMNHNTIRLEDCKFKINV